MKILDNILLATDLSKSSHYVVNEAIEMAKIFQSEITLIYVLPNTISDKKARDLLEEHANNQLEVINGRIKNEGISTTAPILEYGDFSDRITRAAESIDTNLVMIGAGEKVIDDVFVLGSNAEKIIKKSIKPVYVVKNKSGFSINKILCPIDYSDESARALQNAITMAHRFDAELIIFTAYDVTYIYSIHLRMDVEQEIAKTRSGNKRAFAEFLNKFNLTGLKVTTLVEEGVADVAILKTIENYSPDLLIMGTTGKSGLRKLLIGSVTEKVIRKAPISFMTIKKENAIELRLQSTIRTIDEHYETGRQLAEDGFFENAINEFKACLDMNFMHLPSLKALAETYKSMGDTANEKKYNDMANQVLEAMNNQKIEEEIRNFRKN